MMLPLSHINLSLRSLSVLMVRYVITGIVSGLPFLLLVYLGLSYFEWTYVFASLAPFGLTHPLAYVLHRKFTFDSRQNITREALKFLFVGVIFFALSSALRRAGVELLPDWLILGITWISMALSNFFVYVFWVFRPFEKLSPHPNYGEADDT